MKKIESQIEIRASAERVWELLTDFESMPGWNPFIAEISGEPKEGERLRVRIQPPGGKAMSFTPTVLRAEPGRELRWLGRLLLPRVADGEHYFVIDELDGGRIRFTQGEEFRGVLVPLLGGTFAKVARGFEQMNEALKGLAETPAGS